MLPCAFAYSTDTVRENLRRFQRGRDSAVCRKPYPGPYSKLRPDELQTVAAILQATPALTAEQLCARIEADYGIRYTPAGLKNMLRKQLQSHCSEGWSREPPAQCGRSGRCNR